MLPVDVHPTKPSDRLTTREGAAEKMLGPNPQLLPGGWANQERGLISDPFLPLIQRPDHAFCSSKRQRAWRVRESFEAHFQFIFGLFHFDFYL